jgi:hypothetical protein
MGKKNKSQRFVDTLTAGLIKLGAKEIHSKIDSYKSFEIDTIAGSLAINVDKDVKLCYTMFACFENVKEAKTKFDCNPHSGKYNKHISHTADMTPEKAADICLAMIQKTLPTKLSFKELKVGQSYKRVSHMLGGAKQDVTCISEDTTGLERGIKYFCFKDSIEPLPSEKEVKLAMQEWDSPRMRQIRMNIFSVWDFELSGEIPSCSFFNL